MDASICTSDEWRGGCATVIASSEVTPVGSESCEDDASSLVGDEGTEKRARFVEERKSHCVRIALDESKTYDERLVAARTSWVFPKACQMMYDYHIHDPETQADGPPLRCSFCIVDGNGVPTLCKQEATGKQLYPPSLGEERALREICLHQTCPKDLLHLGADAAEMLLGSEDIESNDSDAADMLRIIDRLNANASLLWAQVPDTLTFLCPEHRHCIKKCKECGDFFAGPTPLSQFCFSCEGASEGSDDDEAQPAQKKRKVDNE